MCLLYNILQKQAIYIILHYIFDLKNQNYILCPRIRAFFTLIQDQEACCFK